MKYHFQILFVVSVLVFSCKPTAEQGEKTSQRNKEAREDQAKFDDASAHKAQIKNTVFPDVETTPIHAAASDDSADDPAFWYNQTNPDSSVVYGSNKKGGIYAYSLMGNTIAYYPFGKVNNIDVRQGWVCNGDTLDVLGATNRTSHSLDLYKIDSVGGLNPLMPNPFFVDYGIDDVYGQCMYMPTDTTLFAVANGKNGVVYLYKVSKEQGRFVLSKADSAHFDTQIEGMVADDQNQILYVAEEETGIWAVSLSNHTKTLILESSAEANPTIAYDIEGITLYKKDSVSKFLIASIQGGFNYAVFEAHPPYAYMGSFKVDDTPQIDGTEETDGIDIYSNAIGTTFPHGLFMAQDGYNYEGDSLISQNFKFVALEKIVKLFAKE